MTLARLDVETSSAMDAALDRQTAGPPGLLSLRVLVSEQESVAAGDYNGRFLHAQALGTLFAMRDAGRPVLLRDSEPRGWRRGGGRAARGCHRASCRGANIA